ncbi:MAG: TonB-dependent receptor plug domain-containing protein [Arcobacteraceae bacterium]
MRNYIVIFILSLNFLNANPLASLLEEYKETTSNSLQTVDEKLGHVLVYSQKELKQMQHNKLSDVLQELPLLNLNRNKYGLTSPSLAGTKTTVSGFFRLYINDHEVSSIYSQSFALSWGELPLDFVDHIEVYYGESSFSLGNETGIYFIRVYTKSAQKENATQLKTLLSNNGSVEQSVTHSDVFENGWAYLLFLNQNKLNNDNTYNGEKLKNDSKNRYLYLDLNNDTTKINFAYTDLTKDNYMGLSTDIVPDSGEIKSKNYFIDVSKTFLRDNSLKIGGSYDINERYYDEKNAKIWLIPELKFGPGLNASIPKEYNENLKFTKTTGYISKNFNVAHNKLLTSFHIKNKKQKVIDRTIVNNGNQIIIDQPFNNFNEETIYSFILEDDYKVNDKLLLIANAKYDRYNRNEYLENSNEKMHRIGAIYTPFENFGLKSFYTKTYLPPSFYNVDFASFQNKNMRTQKYKIFTTEGVFTTEKSKFGITYHNVKIDDFIYFSPVGFINVDHRIKNRGLIFDYKYNISQNNEIKFNYYMTKTSETANNAENGGYVKFMGKYSKFEYFTSVIYRSQYQYTPTTSNHVLVPSSYNLSLGTTYNYTKDLSFSIKAENLLNKSTQSLFYNRSTTTNFSLDDFDRTIYLSAKWVF